MTHFGPSAGQIGRQDENSQVTSRIISDALPVAQHVPNSPIEAHSHSRVVRIRKNDQPPLKKKRVELLAGNRDELPDQDPEGVSPSMHAEVVEKAPDRPPGYFGPAATVVKLAPERGSAEKFARARSLRFLYLFSGPSRKGDFLEHARALGEQLRVEIHVDCKDLLQENETDLLDERSWETIYSNINDAVYDLVAMSPPCDTFGSLLGAPVRAGSVVGLLRGSTGADRYGAKKIQPKDKERVRTATFLTVKCAQAAQMCHSRHIPF